MDRQKVNAIVIKRENETEVRCRNCGKLLFKMYNNFLNLDVDKSSHYDIIVSRCTRNACKTDNVLRLGISP